MADPASQDDADVLMRVRRLLFGSAEARAEPAQAIALLRESAARGSGEAALRAAVALATGAAAPPDWRTALDLLCRAAALGAPSARAQLALLSGRAEAALEAASDAELQAALNDIDVEALLAPPPVRMLREAPFIGVMDQFASPLVAAWVMRAAEPHLKRSLVYDQATGEVGEDPARTGMTAVLGLMERDMVVALLQARAARASGIPVSGHEPPNVLCYAPGQRFDPHFDFLDPSVPRYREELSAIGQRVATCLTYLNDDYDGGETVFLDIGFSFRGRIGDCLVFRNVGPDRQPDFQTRHAGVAPARGHKWLLSQWLRDKPQFLM